jgi:hypothetical protein
MGHISCWSVLMMVGDNINTIKEKTETLSRASRDVGLEINVEKAKYMIMSRHPNSGQNQNIMTATESFENVAKFRYLKTTLTNRNDFHDEINSRLYLGICIVIQSRIFLFLSHIKRTKD